MTMLGEIRKDIQAQSREQRLQIKALYSWIISQRFKSIRRKSKREIKVYFARTDGFEGKVLIKWWLIKIIWESNRKTLIGIEVK